MIPRGFGPTPGDILRRAAAGMEWLGETLGWKNARGQHRPLVGPRGMEAGLIRTWSRRRRQEHASRLAAHLLAHPADRHYGRDTEVATGLRSAVTYRLLWRWLAVGWLQDGWDEVADGQVWQPRRYYMLTVRGQRELADIVGQRGRPHSIS